VQLKQQQMEIETQQNYVKDEEVLSVQLSAPPSWNKLVSLSLSPFFFVFNLIL
jgi:hypothetical protein